MSQWVRIHKFGNLCFRKYPTQDDRSHLEKTDSRESPAEIQEIRAQVKTPAAHNTKIVTRDSDANVGVGQKEELAVVPNHPVGRDQNQLDVASSFLGA